MERVNNKRALKLAFDNIGDDMLRVWKEDFDVAASIFKEYFVNGNEVGLSPYAARLAYEAQDDFSNIENKDEQDEFCYSLAIKAMLVGRAEAIMTSL